MQRNRSSRQRLSFIWLLFFAAVVSTAYLGATALASRHCEIRVSTRSQKIRINGTAIGGFELAKIKKALGEPTRKLTRTKKVRFERFGNHKLRLRPHSTRVSVTDYHYVYDHLGLVFSTANGRFQRSTTPVMLYVVYGRSKAAHNDEPAVMPRRWFTGTLRINGERVDPRSIPIPKDVNYKTARFPLYKASFSSTSRATLIDSVYSYDKMSLRVFLVNSGQTRAAYVQIK